MHLGILVCGHPPDEIAEQFGRYGDMFAGLFDGRGWRTTVWHVVDMEFPHGIHAADAWLLTGSRHGVYEDLAFIAPLEAFVRAASAADRPMLGICFGHQIIAQALGGRVEKFAGGWELGRKHYSIDGLGEVPVHAWHQDQVLEAPEGAEIVARAPGCAIAALAYGEQILTLQPHPEFDTEITAAFVRLRGDDPIYPRHRMAAAAESLIHPVDNQAVVDWMADFLETAVSGRGNKRQRRHG